MAHSNTHEDSSAVLILAKNKNARSLACDVGLHSASQANLFYDMNKAALIEKINNIEGLTSEERSDLLKLLREHKKYGLVWEDKPEDVEERLRDELPVLREVKSREILSDAPDAPNHIIIEGDNLEALTALSYTHEGQIDVIYIDPPYNTGNKDFVYNDSYVDSEDDYRHSKWLSFMAKRLRIAKRLLSQRGIIFISIDDNEQADIKMLCDDMTLFGERNFIAQLIWQQGKKHIGSFIGVNHEYMLVYAKNKDFINDNNNKWHQRKEGLDDIYKEYEALKKTHGLDFEAIEQGMKTFYDSLSESNPAYGSKHYNKVDARGLFFADNISQGTGNGPRYDVIHPTTGKPVRLPAGGWRYSEDTMNKLLSEDRIFFGEDETKVPCRKRYLKETEYELPASVFYRDGRGASKELETILGGKFFNNPKDRNEIARILNFRENNVILDFFAGSGTTLHATMQLNAEDGGSRRCILVTNNENGICENVTYERNKRVINGYTKPNGEAVEGLQNNNLRYFKTDFLPRERTQRNMRELVSAATELLCIKEDLYTEKKNFGKYRTNPRAIRYFADDKKQMLIIYREELIEQLVEEIKTLDFGKEKLKVYLFSPGRTAFPELFEEVQDKVDTVALPAAIYDAYQKVLPKRKQQLPDLEVAEENVAPQKQEMFADQEKGGEA